MTENEGVGSRSMRDKGAVVSQESRNQWLVSLLHVQAPVTILLAGTAVGYCTSAVRALHTLQLIDHSEGA